MGMKLNLPINVPASMSSLPTIKFYLHIAQVALTLMTIILVAPVISIEAKYWGGSKAAPNWTLIVGILTLLVPVGMVYFPWAYDRQDKFKVLGKFFLKSRSALVLTVFNSFLWLTAALAMTVHSSDAVNCALDGNLEKADGSYAASWANQCNCGKATAAFAWFTSFAWLGTVVISGLVMYSEKQQIQQNLKNHEMDAAADRHDDPVDPSYRTYDEEADYQPTHLGNTESMPLNSPPDMHQQQHYYDHSPPPRQQTYSPDYPTYGNTPTMPIPQPTPSPTFGQAAHANPNAYDTIPPQPAYYH
ncbi:hypothetical protein BC943DRAFT_329105 [Umbelopsis sp. AD052]|nr:hypothetical protein BC943DRAFT_329105 [Umbelopsis sp. AD052]